MRKRVKKKDTLLFFDSFKHFKNNISNLICIELPKLVELGNTIDYCALKPVNYKSKLPDMRKIGLIYYNKPEDGEFVLTDEGKAINDIISNRLFYLYADIRYDNRVETVQPSYIWTVLSSDEQQIIKNSVLKLLLTYYDSADSIRPYTILLKKIDELKTKKVDKNFLCLILSQFKLEIMKKTALDRNAYTSLSTNVQEEIKRPISYIKNFLLTAGIINDEDDFICDMNYVKNINYELDEIYQYIDEYSVSQRSGRSATEQRLFRENVLKAYNYKCAITGESISINKQFNEKSYILDACHIIPFSDGGSFSTNNGIALTPALHKLFDHKLFSFKYIDENTIIVVVTSSNKVNDRTGVLKNINNIKISLPEEKSLRPDPVAIGYRKDKYLLD